MNKFLEAFVYFIENGLDPKIAKEFAEKVTGIKAPKGEIKIPKTKGPDEFRMPEAKQDVIEASDNVSGNYAAGDTKYNADILVFIKSRSPRSFLVINPFGVGSLFTGLFSLFKLLKNS